MPMTSLPFTGLWGNAIFRRKSHMVEFLLSQRQHHAAPRTINRRLTVVCSFLNYLEPGWGDRLFKNKEPAFYKGTRNKALLAIAYPDL